MEPPAYPRRSMKFLVPLALSNVQRSRYSCGCLYTIDEPYSSESSASCTAASGSISRRSQAMPTTSCCVDEPDCSYSPLEGSRQSHPVSTPRTDSYANRPEVRLDQHFDSRVGVGTSSFRETLLHAASWSDTTERPIKLAQCTHCPTLMSSGPSARPIMLPVVQA